MLVYESKLFNIELEGEERFRLRVEGPLSYLASHFVHKLNSMLAHEKPIGMRDGQYILSTWIPPIPSPALERLIRANLRAAMGWHSPEQVSIAITTRCSNKCAHCSAAFVPKSELPYEVVRRTISDALRLGAYIIAFDGGEPLFRGDLEDLISNVPPEKAIATTFTSGYGLTRRRAEALKASGLYAARVSIDFPYAPDQDKFRGRKGAFLDAYKAIENALFNDILVDMYVVVGPHNIDHLDDFYEMACDLGVSELTLCEVIEVGNWKGGILSKEDVRRVAKFHVEKNSKKEGVRVTSLPYLMSGDMFGCFAGKKWAHVTAAGDVLPCAYIPHSFGNVNRESFVKGWRRIRRSSLMRGSPGSCRMRDKSFRQKVLE